MSTDTPRPERVTLTDDERRARAQEYAAFWWQRETGETDEWVNLDAEEREAVVENSYAETVADWLAAREQALREEIAGQIEAKYLGPDSGRGYDGREAPDAALRNAYDEGLEMAARIALGEIR